MWQAAEVALLTRNIVIDAPPTAHGDPLVGGHVIVDMTQTPQYVVGVEFVGLGQQGNLGRYPVHFHMCGRCATDACITTLELCLQAIAYDGEVKQEGSAGINGCLIVTRMS